MLNDSVNATPPVSRIYLVDGTYELFRSYFGAPKATTAAGPEVGATRGILRSLFALVREPAVTHIACAFDHVIESFRNDLFDGYKTSAGVPDDLMAQFPLAERAAHALGIVVWPMVEFEADDAIAAAAERWRDAPGVEQIVLCTPDKDMAQCVRDNKVVCLDRRQRRVIDAAGVIEKFGVPPASIPDWLALVGDAADGYPGVPRWGGKSAAALLAHYGHIESIPDRESEWRVSVRGAAALAASLREHRDEAYLYRRLATLRVDVPLSEQLDDLRWRGARREELTTLCREIEDEEFIERVSTWRGDDVAALRRTARSDGTTGRRCESPVRWARRSSARVRCRPSNLRTGPSDHRSGPSHRRPLAPSDRTSIPLLFPRSRNISNNTSSSSLPSITTCLLNRPHSTNPRPR